MSVIPQHSDRVDWRRVALFYGIALLGPVLSFVVLNLLGGSMRSGLESLFAGASAMLFPLAAGLIVERVARRETLLAREWRRSKGRRLRAVGAIWGWGAVAFLLICGVGLLVAWLTASGNLPGAGAWRTQAEVDAVIARLSPAAAGISTPVAVLVGSSLVQAFIAGMTINGVFAFGEEYGWRGVLAEELRPLGVVKANLVIGVIWGLWHAPLIALGHNYGAAWLPGIFMFVLITTPLSFILWWARERSTWLPTAAVVHGAFNGFAGIYALLVAGGDVLLAVPVGVFGAVALAIVAAILWLVPGLRPASDRARPELATIRPGS